MQMLPFHKLKITLLTEQEYLQTTFYRELNMNSYAEIKKKKQTLNEEKGEKVQNRERNIRTYAEKMCYNVLFN